MNILEVQNLTVTAKSDLLQRKLLNNVSFELKQGKTLGIVGESGSGKTSLILAILNLIKSKGKKARKKGRQMP